jgi:hypothetical protein
MYPSEMTADVNVHSTVTAGQALYASTSCRSPSTTSYGARLCSDRVKHRILQAAWEWWQRIQHHQLSHGQLLEPLGWLNSPSWTGEATQQAAWITSAVVALVTREKARAILAGRHWKPREAGIGQGEAGEGSGDCMHAPPPRQAASNCSARHGVVQAGGAVRVQGVPDEGDTMHACMPHAHRHHSKGLGVNSIAAQGEMQVDKRRGARRGAKRAPLTVLIARLGDVTLGETEVLDSFVLHYSLAHDALYKQPCQ